MLGSGLNEEDGDGGSAALSNENLIGSLFLPSADAQ